MGALDSILSREASLTLQVGVVGYPRRPPRDSAVPDFRLLIVDHDVNDFGRGNTTRNRLREVV
jgi:hypothetical protein